MSLQTLNENLNIIQNLVIPFLEDDLDNIQKLDDEPNDVGGLTAAELKAEFDKSGNTIKKYLNETLIPQLSDTVAEAEVRATAERERVSNENQRVANENQRVANENARVEEEASRAVAEAERIENEDARNENETKRVQAETARANAEADRVNAESARAEAEQARAEAADQVKNMSVSANTLSAGSSATVTKSIANGALTITFGIPKGDKGDTGSPGKDGDPGEDGEPGADGVSVVSVEQTTTSTEDGGVNVVTVTLSDGSKATFQVKNGSRGSAGVDGSNGTNGQDGYTPVRGTDYWTTADRQQMVSDVLAALPTWEGGSY